MLIEQIIPELKVSVHKDSVSYSADLVKNFMVQPEHQWRSISSQPKHCLHAIYTTVPFV